MRASLAAVIFGLSVVVGVGTPKAEDKQFDIRGVAVAAPAPSGFVNSETVSPEVMRLFQAWTPPENRLLAVFVSAQDFARLLSGETPLFDRYMHVQVPRASEHAFFSMAEFRQMATLIRNQHGTIVSMTEDRADRLVQKGSKEMSEEMDVALDMKLGETRTLGVFLDRPRAISFASIVKYHTKVEGDEADHTVAGTTSFVLAEGKLIYAYVYRNFRAQEDLDWVRLATHDWVSKILAAND